MMRCVRCATLSLIAMAFAAGDVSGQTLTFQWFNQGHDGAAENDWHLGGKDASVNKQDSLLVMISGGSHSSSHHEKHGV